MGEEPLTLNFCGLDVLLFGEAGLYSRCLSTWPLLVLNLVGGSEWERMRSGAHGEGGLSTSVSLYSAVTAVKHQTRLAFPGKNRSLAE